MLSKKNNKTKSKKGILIRLFSYILNLWYLFIPAILMTLLSNQLALLGPRFSGEAIDAIAADGGVNFDMVRQNVGRICHS